ncbi:MAG: transcription factor [Desulfurococcales archaeon]|nr:transcription factor [Desulfurococcales archaeon]MEB3789318.1 transcription factor [Desulfurococcales archaeon]
MKNAENGDQNSENRLRSLLLFVDLLARKNRLDPEKALTIFKALLASSEDSGLSDEDISLKMGYKQSDVRRILRTFYMYKLARYRRGKHPETGATRFYWYIDVNLLNSVLLWRKKAVLEKLKYRLQYEEENYFYRCPRDKTRYTFEEAYSYEFICPKCGSVLEEEDNTEIKKILSEYIKRLEEEIIEDERKIQSS